jgi:hypothetical protein
MLSDGEGTSRVAALAGDFDFFGSGVLTGLTTVFLAGLNLATAWEMRTFVLLGGCHVFSPLELKWTV